MTFAELNLIFIHWSQMFLQLVNCNNVNCSDICTVDELDYLSQLSTVVCKLFVVAAASIIMQAFCEELIIICMHFCS